MEENRWDEMREAATSFMERLIVARDTPNRWMIFLA